LIFVMVFRICSDGLNWDGMPSNWLWLGWGSLLLLITSMLYAMARDNLGEIANLSAMARGKIGKIANLCAMARDKMGEIANLCAMAKDKMGEIANL
jgi:hypothetical protein